MNNTTEKTSFEERINTGTSKTGNKFFDENGFYLIKGLCDPKVLFCELPQERGQFNYWGKKENQFVFIGDEPQVKGSLSRYWHPQYREIHSQIRMKLEKELGIKLYNTYYYDRFYFPGQKLERHIDRGACEISVTVHVSTNLPKKKRDWPIWIKTPDVYEDESKRTIIKKGENKAIILLPGDGLVYKGCERPHWREAMPKNSFWKDQNKTYYHQIFFHYVLQNGLRAHHAFDSAK